MTKTMKISCFTWASELMTGSIRFRQEGAENSRCVAFRVTLAEPSTWKS